MKSTKTYKIYYTESGTCYNFCKVLVKADSEEEAINAVKDNDWEKIIDTDVYDTEYEDDYHVTEIESVEEINGD